MSRFDALDQQAVNALRVLSIDMVQEANSGHPGLPLGAAPAAYVLFTRHLRCDPRDPSWPDRDRFVLSAGHGSALLYSLLHLGGFGLSLDELKQFRQWGSRTPGHPESFITQGVEATTGPLGQGCANSVGMAVAERHLAHRFGSDLVDHRSWALVGDGDLMEGLTYEAASLAGHLGLGKLCWIYDANDVSLDGPLSMSFSENVAQRFEACGWQVLEVADGDEDLDGIDDAMNAARQENAKPSLVVVRSTIGYGSPHKAGLSAAHGAPLGEDEVALTREKLGWEDPEPFVIPEAIRERFRERLEATATQHARWQTHFDTWSAAEPARATAWKDALEGTLPTDLDAILPGFKTGISVATRVASGKVLNTLAEKIPWLIGGDADLGSSTKTGLSAESDFDGATGAGRNLHFGVREHAMAAIANGICYHGGARPFVSTFFCFSDYMRPSMRLAALSGLDPIYIFTHDSISVGEDGPTHQPVEHLAALRSIPRLTVIRPGDAHECTAAWKWILQNAQGPSALVLSRQSLPILDREHYASADGLLRGGYVLAEAGAPAQVTLVASGSELSLAVAARETLEKQGVGVRVVSLPSWEIFESQEPSYRSQIIPPEPTLCIGIEAGVRQGWDRWLGPRGVFLGMNRFGASAPGERLQEAFGFTRDHLVEMVLDYLS